MLGGMTHRFSSFAIGLILAFGLRDTYGADSFPLWAEGAPEALGKAAKDIPTLTVFAADPAGATGAAFIICPGGGYGSLADYEGSHYAKYLNEHGIAGFVLKYRLAPGGYHHPSMLQDAARALRTIRSRAQEWGLKTNQIGIMGSSAGGHLATTLLTHYDAGKPEDSDPIERQSSRPDLGILCYPVVTMGTFTHEGSLHNLLGKEPTGEQRAELSNELHVTKDTPPCFIWHTDEDAAVPVENSLQFAAALRKARVPFDLHIYEKGAHGLALGSKEYDPSKWHPWTRDCAFWLKQRGWGK
jgi:acetyl esterase/lipase